MSAPEKAHLPRPLHLQAMCEATVCTLAGVLVLPRHALAPSDNVCEFPEAED